jgi:hypothetical protein
MPDVQADDRQKDKRPLDDLMLAMDVVDTLRHRAVLVQRELGEDDRDDLLIERLRSIYAAQGIEVPDHVLAEGVRALKEGRFIYAPPQPGLSVSLARLYVDRRRWGPWALTACALVAAVWLGYVLLVSGPRQRQLGELPGQLASLEKKIVTGAHLDSAVVEAKQIAEQGQQAVLNDDLDRAQSSLAALQELSSRLDQEYELRIVSQGSTGVWRVPDVNSGARNYYIIVQAITPAGEVLTLPIKNEEDGQVRLVNKWGLRVDDATFQAVADDKRDDGIIQKNRFGVKRPGSLELEYLMPTTGAAITSW